MKNSLEKEIVVLLSTVRHGVDEESALHAYRNAVVRFAFDEGCEMHIGADATSRLLEGGTVRAGERLLLGSAMPARSKYLSRGE